MRHFAILTSLILSISATSCAATGNSTGGESPSNLHGLVLTWQQDPTTTMTIDWHTDAGGEPSELEYKKVGPAEWEVEIDREVNIWRYLRVQIDEWKTVSAEQIDFPYSDRIIHRVELTGLEPDTEYFFRIGDEIVPRKFRTMPENANNPIRFAVGGDVRHNAEWMDYMNRRVATYEPDFIVWGGDLAYGDGREDFLFRWYEFMEIMERTLITPDGRVIPVLAGIGNHEVLPGRLREELPPYSQDDEHRKLIGPYYYTLFAFPGQPGYEVLDFSDYLSIILLDSGHSNPVSGEQTEWLASVLEERQHIPHVFPNYHVPAYPSVRDPDGNTSVSIRENWVPLFEQYGIKVAFENHDHSYKRTFPIRNGQIDPEGVVYIGDGAWGVMTRDIGRHHDEMPWFVKRGAPERHFILTTIHGTHRHFKVVNEHGKVIDEYPRTNFFDLDATKHFAPLIHGDKENDE